MFKLIDFLKRQLIAKLFVIYLRYLTGFAFVFASIVKIKGERFTQIPPTEGIGYFFEAMYQSGFYWNFLGWGQFISGALLMTQRFATLGALVFFPVILNVFMITHSIDFGSGTPLITSMMLLGTLFLLAWDYKKWVILFQNDHQIKLDLTKEPEDKLMNDPIWVIAGILFVLLSVSVHLSGGGYAVSIQWIFAMLGVGTTAFIVGVIRHRRRLNRSKVESVIQ